MLKTALFDCAISEKCCSVDGGMGICRLFSSPHRAIWQLKSPHPPEFAIQGKKKNANARGSAREGGGGGGARRRWNWRMHKYYFNLYEFLKRRIQKLKRKLENRCFCWYPAVILVSLKGTPTRASGKAGNRNPEKEREQKQEPESE